MTSWSPSGGTAWLLLVLAVALTPVHIACYPAEALGEVEEVENEGYVEGIDAKTHVQKSSGGHWVLEDLQSPFEEDTVPSASFLLSGPSSDYPEGVLPMILPGKVRELWARALEGKSKFAKVSKNIAKKWSAADEKMKYSEKMQKTKKGNGDEEKIAKQIQEERKEDSLIKEYPIPSRYLTPPVHEFQPSISSDLTPPVREFQPSIASDLTPPVHEFQPSVPSDLTAPVHEFKSSLPSDLIPPVHEFQPSLPTDLTPPVHEFKVSLPSDLTPPVHEYQSPVPPAPSAQVYEFKTPVNYDLLPLPRELTPPVHEFEAPVNSDETPLPRELTPPVHEFEASLPSDLTPSEA